MYDTEFEEAGSSPLFGSAPEASQKSAIKTIVRRVEPAGRISSGDNTHREKFEKFHRENPHAYEHLKELTLKLCKQPGITKFGFALVYETARYNYLVTHGDSFKLNNNYRSYYARMFKKEFPQYADMVQTREKSGQVSV